MAQPVDWESRNWESRIGRRLRLRDLHVFFAVLQAGSMAKAAANLRVTQPSVSKAIGDLEAALGVRVFDRSPQGVEPTSYGDALRRCGSAMFDDLRQGVKEIEFLSDPTLGELRIGCPESVTSSILPPIIERFSEECPRVVFEIDVQNAVAALPKLRDRSLDLVLAPLGAALLNDPFVNDFNLEILTLPDTWNYIAVKEAFRAHGLGMPDVSIRTMSVHIRANLLATGKFITALPYSVLRLYAGPLALKVLPVDLSRPWPLVIVTLKNRRLSSTGTRFLDRAREVVKSLISDPRAGKA